MIHLSKNVNGEELLETTNPLHTQSSVWQDMSRPLYSGCEQTLCPSSAPEVNWHHGLCTLWVQRCGADSPPHRQGLFHLAATEMAVLAAGWVNHQAAGNSGRPAQHHPIPGSMWTEGLSTADRSQKKKKKKHLSFLNTQEFIVFVWHCFAFAFCFMPGYWLEHGRLWN